MDEARVELALTKIDSGLKKYLSIMNEFHNVDVSNNLEFQRMYNGFYRLRQRTSDFYAEYYEYMEKNRDRNLTYPEVLTHFYNRFNRIEASFSSKLLATINPSMPVWDVYVLNNLGLKKPPYTSKNRLKETIALYEKICDWYAEFLKTDDAKFIINNFDNTYGDVKITEMKKVDLVLWQMR